MPLVRRSPDAGVILTLFPKLPFLRSKSNRTTRRLVKRDQDTPDTSQRLAGAPAPLWHSVERLGEALRFGFSRANVCSLLTEEACRFFRASAAALVLPDEQGQGFLLQGSSDRVASPRQVAWPRPPDPVTQALRRRHPIFEPSAPRNELLAACFPSAAPKSVLAFPLCCGHSIYGVLVLSNPQDLDHQRARQLQAGETLCSLGAAALAMQGTDRADRSTARKKQEYLASLVYDLKEAVDAVGKHLEAVLGGELGPLTNAQKQRLKAAMLSLKRIHLCRTLMAATSLPPSLLP